MYIIIREMSLQPLLEQTPVALHPFFRALHQRMEMGIVHRNHPDPHPGNLSADGHTVPSKYLGARYRNLSVFKNRETDKVKKWP